MSIFKTEWFLVVVPIVVIVGGGIYIANKTIDISLENSRIRRNNIYASGERAHSQGVPAQANPYRYSLDRTKWLDGWMDGKNE